MTKSDDTTTGVEFSVFSLNCWGLKWISSDRSVRFRAISAYLQQDHYDFVFLQEVWVKSDYQFLVNELREVLPFSRYFESGVIGSGLCLFSKAPIRHFFLIPYQANGYFYKVWHGDWFSGKGVAVAQVTYKGLALNLLTTHTHVETEGLEYVAHRVTQAACLVDVINFCLECSDLTILAGDLNTDPEGPLFNLLSRLAGLSDSQRTAETRFTHPSLLQSIVGTRAPVSHIDIDGTCGLPTNVYSGDSYLKKLPNGQRLDYILYRLPIASSNRRVRILTYSRPLPSRIPSEFGKDVSYSDHEAIAASFRYELVSSASLSAPAPLLENETNVDTADSSTQESALERSSSFMVKSPLTRAKSLIVRDSQIARQKVCLAEAIAHLESSIRALSRELIFCFVLSLTLLLLLLGTLYLPCLPVWATVLTNLSRIILSLVLFAIGLVQPIHINQEIHTINASLQSLRSKVL